jgi:hypothetical protein
MRGQIVFPLRKRLSIPQHVQTYGTTDKMARIACELEGCTQFFC